jgi:hypothetical protein
VVVITARCARDAALAEKSGFEGESLTPLGQLKAELWDKETGLYAEPMCLFGGSTTWRKGEFDRFFAAVAQNLVAGLIVETLGGQVFAPYDGGADLFFRTGLERDFAEARYANWVSARPDRL